MLNDRADGGFAEFGSSEVLEMKNEGSRNDSK